VVFACRDYPLCISRRSDTLVTSTLHFTGRHTGETIQREVTSVVDAWKPCQLIHVVTDEASNIAAGLRDAPGIAGHELCAAHRVNLCVQVLFLHVMVVT
jgi:hypothetical protein